MKDENKTTIYRQIIKFLRLIQVRKSSKMVNLLLAGNSLKYNIIEPNEKKIIFFGNNFRKSVSNHLVRRKKRMSSFKFPSFGRGKKQMFFSKAIAFDEEELGSNALVAVSSTANLSAEADFIEKLKTGEAAAFDTLVTRYSADIYALLYRITEDAEEAGDLTQETFLNALRAIKNFRGEADLKTWLFRIAINESRNRFRWWKRRKRETTISLDTKIGESETTLGETFSSREQTPEENLLAREREEKLRRALSDLPAHFRETIVLCDIEGFSYEEIATLLQINIGTVKSRIARGREELRKRLSDI